MKITNQPTQPLNSLLQAQQSQAEKLASAKRINSAADDAAEQRGQTELGEELILLPLAGRLAVRQQVDQDHW